MAKKRNMYLLTDLWLSSYFLDLDLALSVPFYFSSYYLKELSILNG